MRLNEFKELYKALKTGVVWVDYLLFSFVYWLEEKVIDSRIQNEVDRAVEEVVKRASELPLPPLPDMVTPVYRETPSASANSHSETSTSLPNMRLTAPWYDDTAGERSEL